MHKIGLKMYKIGANSIPEVTTVKILKKINKFKSNRITCKILIEIGLIVFEKPLAQNLGGKIINKKQYEDYKVFCWKRKTLLIT